ncbi:STAS domain-containing protein [Mycobacterium ulcerans]|uniref:Conserved hypothetical membrane protein n=1 Tax=Mycobacterium ulcerans (strain Agy99) TaxID=362242 RepID=A0PVP4_MYCUA|nr:STAS domain-containing protein [Mycobacterium ulcerans]ABL06413.1 conserved hypothetical membrane protein [Mycobacterium ulcerans Agy99]MEB3904789.1 STAS domain-containing protein [Mycobacterium ulcerans]MEB3908984.1 STAS domain-containing protein [Mycobacterium ulcerans]MEB3919183.1 STAS domain-containing protein [Mycobacterium ulcerans]MEB3923306.1 STAS domain-containing protein [Mycobacterium ulcerans]
MNATAKSPNALAIDTRSEDSLVVLSVEGAIDSTNCAALRDAIIKATLDEPSAVVVNVSALQVPDEASWSIFVSARWQVDTPQHVPILLVCASRAGRELITRTGVTRFMPVYPTEKRAIKAVGRLARRKVRYAQVQLPANLGSLRESRKLVREWLTSWSKPGLIPVALVIVNVFVENVLEHTGSDPVIKVQCDGTAATIAVSDGSNAPAIRLQTPPKGIDVSGLAIVEALCRAWGSTPTATGKTVWAIIGPENQL